MLDRDLVWKSILQEIEAKHPTKVIPIINRFVLMMPQILKHQLNNPVSMMDLLSARIRVARKLKYRGLSKKMAQVEVDYTPLSSSCQPHYTERFLRDNFDHWLDKQVDTNTKLLAKLVSGKMDGPTVWELRDYPDLGSDQILLRRELNNTAVEHLRDGSLNFARLLEIQAGAIFPRLKV